MKAFRGSNFDTPEEFFVVYCIWSMRSDCVSRRNALASISTAGLVLLSGCGSFGGTSSGSSDVIHVSTDGIDDNSGAEDAPLSSIQTAVEQAQPGQTIRARPGECREFIEFRTDGTPDAPITLTGPPDAVLKPPENADHGAIGVGASHIHITGLTISGLYNPDRPETAESYTPSHLVTLNTWAEESDDYLEGLVISPHGIGNAGGALINSVMIKNSTIGGFKVIGPAGAYWLFDDKQAGHYGEIVYLGTSPDNRVERGYDDYDRTRNIRVHHIDNSEGHPHAELVDCKEGVSDVTVEYCTDAGGIQSDDSVFSTAITLRGFDCTVRWNVIQDAEGSGIEIGPWGTMTNPDFLGEPETDFERRLGTGHAIYGNVFTGNTLDAIDFLRESAVPGQETNPLPEDQRMICDNLVDAYSDGTPSKKCDSGHPLTDGVGHLGGESPWNGTAPTTDEILVRDAQNPHLNVEVETTTATVNGSLEIPVSVTNKGEDTAEVELELRVGDYVFDTRRLTVPSNETRQMMFSSGAPSAPTEVSLLRNGQKVAGIEVRDA